MDFHENFDVGMRTSGTQIVVKFCEIPDLEPAPEHHRAPPVMKIRFSKSLEKILYLTTLVCPHHIPSLPCGVIPNFEIFTAHKMEIDCRGER